MLTISFTRNTVVMTRFLVSELTHSYRKHFGGHQIVTYCTMVVIGLLLTSLLWSLNSYLVHYGGHKVVTYFTMVVTRLLLTSLW